MSDAISLTPVELDSLPMRERQERKASLGEITGLLGNHFGGRPISIYEAGGGSTSYVPLGDLNVAHITLVDIDPRQVARNDIAEPQVDASEHGIAARL